MPETEPEESAIETPESPTAPEQQNPITLSINILTAPTEAFKVIKERPSSLFPWQLSY